MIKDDIIAALPRLSAKERGEVQLAIKMLGALDGGPSPAEPTLSEDWVLSGIATYLARRGLIPERSGVHDLRRRDAYKQYLSKLPSLMGFLTKLEQDNKLGKRHRVTVAFLCARSLGDMLERRNYFSVSAMLSQVDKMPEALDLAYPGYIAANLFGFILQRSEGNLL